MAVLLVPVFQERVKPKRMVMSQVLGKSLGWLSRVGFWLYTRESSRVSHSKEKAGLLGRYAPPRQSVAHLQRWEYTLLHSSYTQVWLLLSLKIQSNFQGRTRTDRAQSGTVEEGTKRRSQSTDQRGNLTGQESAKDKVCKAQPPCYFLHVPSLLLKGNMCSLKEPHASCIKWQLWIIHLHTFLSLSLTLLGRNHNAHLCKRNNF